jgi:predicted DCC family thiol-disulfide oxidoreductase YuxK
MSAPVRPTIVFDGDCGFCRRTATRWKKRFDRQIDFISFDECLLAEAKTRDFRSMVRFIAPDGAVYGGASAVAEMFAFTGHSFWRKLYQLPVFHQLGDLGYTIVASNRGFFGKFL